MEVLSTVDWSALDMYSMNTLFYSESKERH